MRTGLRRQPMGQPTFVGAFQLGKAPKEVSTDGVRFHHGCHGIHILLVLSRSFRLGRAQTGHPAHMTMPSDAADAVETNGANEGPRDHEGVDTDHAAYVDEDNVPHPGDANEAG